MVLKNVIIWLIFSFFPYNSTLTEIVSAFKTLKKTQIRGWFGIEISKEAQSRGWFGIGSFKTTQFRGWFDIRIEKDTN